MSRSLWLLSCGVLGIAAPAAAQDAAGRQTLSGAATTTAPAATPAEQAGAVGGAAAAAAEEPSTNVGDIVVTATRRASPLSDVPIAVSAVTAASLQNSGASDLRQLNQLTPSLLVSSTSSEAGAGGARIRGIGTVGDNAGLESSVATFIDGVYRNRAGVGLTELGPIDRVEVLRGPQGTLFGRNASAGLINVVTARPKFEEEGYAEASYGNYDYKRFGAGVTGPIGTKVAYRLDGIYLERDGFLKDVVSGRRVNDRDRYLIRGKLLFEPIDTLSVLLIGDYTKRSEECCSATYLPARDVTRNADGTLAFGPSSIAALERGLTSVIPGNGNGIIRDDTYSRLVSITPGRNYTSNVRDFGGSAEINWDLGAAKLTSISAYRDWRYIQGQDADFNNLDLLYRTDDGGRATRFRTFSQELRLQGSLFDDKLDWLLGGYYAHERLDQGDNLSYGLDYDNFTTARVRQLSPAFGALAPFFAAFPGFANLKAFSTSLASAALPAATPGRAQIIPLFTNAVANAPLSGTGDASRYKQIDTNFAAFTHNIINITDTLSLTLGARYTRDRKNLDANLVSNTACAGYAQSVNNLKAIAAANPGLAQLAGGYASILQALVGLPCVVNSVNGNFTSAKREGEWSGTAVLSFKPTPRLLTYASFSRGYKAGGFNLDRAPLFNQTTFQQAGLDALKFQPEKVNSYELGAKYKTRGFNLNVAAFYAQFQSFQLNTFNGTSFFVTDVRGCKDALGTTDQDVITTANPNAATNSTCANYNKKGVTSKGVEVEAFLQLARDFSTSLGFTLADTRYAKDLAGSPDPFTGNNSLSPALFLLPGGRVSNSSEYVVTGAATWTPPLGDKLRGLAYTDFRYTSELNTGSDLFVEKAQSGVMIVNARLGVGAADRSWSIEGFAQNLTNVNYKQVAFNATLQGSNTSSVQTQQFGTAGTQLFGAFLAEPRTYGVTVRTKF